VAVFAKETGDALTSLVKQLDKVVADNADSKAAAFVNIIGEDQEKLEETAKQLGKPLENVAVVVPIEFEVGPKDYGVNPEAGVTVLVYRGGKVAANHAIAPGKLDDKAIKAIVEDAQKTLGKDG
jgi:hypothetical protein